MPPRASLDPHGALTSRHLSGQHHSGAGNSGEGGVLLPAVGRRQARAPGLSPLGSCPQPGTGRYAGFTSLRSDTGRLSFRRFCVTPVAGGQASNCHGEGRWVVWCPRGAVLESCAWQEARGQAGDSKEREEGVPPKGPSCVCARAVVLGEELDSGFQARLAVCKGAVHASASRGLCSLSGFCRNPRGQCQSGCWASCLFLVTCCHLSPGLPRAGLT